MKIKLFQHPPKNPNVKPLGPGHEAEQVRFKVSRESHNLCLSDSSEIIPLIPTKQAEEFDDIWSGMT